MTITATSNVMEVEHASSALTPAASTSTPTPTPSPAASASSATQPANADAAHPIVDDITINALTLNKNNETSASTPVGSTSSLLTMNGAADSATSGGEIAQNDAGKAKQATASGEGEEKEELKDEQKSAALSALTPATAASAPSPSSSSPPVLASTDPAVTSSSGELMNGGYKRPGAENDPVTGYYDEIEIEDMDYDEETETYTYPCPCGDRFAITKEELLEGEDIARCPSCSLLIKVIYDPDDLEDE